MLVVACRMLLIVLHFNAEDQSSNQNIDRAVSCNIRNFCTYIFLCATHSDALTRVLMHCGDIRS